MSTKTLFNKKEVKMCKFNDFSDEMLEEFESYSDDEQLEDSGIYNITAYAIDRRSKCINVIILAERNGWTEYYNLDSSYNKNFFIKINMEEMKKKGCIIIEGQDLVILASLNQKPFIRITMCENGKIYPDYCYPRIKKFELIEEQKQ
jgi:hypothetical protein